MPSTQPQHCEGACVAPSSLPQPRDNLFGAVTQYCVGDLSLRAHGSSLWRLFTSTTTVLPLKRPAPSQDIFFLMPNIISSLHSFLHRFCPTLCSSVLARFLPAWPPPALLLLCKAPVGRWVCLLAGEYALCKEERSAWVSRSPDGQLEKGEEVRAVKHPAARCGVSHRISSHQALHSLSPPTLVAWVSRTA